MLQHILRHLRDFLHKKQNKKFEKIVGIKFTVRSEKRASGVRGTSFSQAIPCADLDYWRFSGEKHEQHHHQIMSNLL